MYESFNIIWLEENFIPWGIWKNKWNKNLFPLKLHLHFTLPQSKIIKSKTSFVLDQLCNDWCSAWSSFMLFSESRLNNLAWNNETFGINYNNIFFKFIFKTIIQSFRETLIFHIDPESNQIVNVYEIEFFYPNVARVRWILSVSKMK